MCCLNLREMNREAAKNTKKTFLNLRELCVFAVKMVRG
jgi:hypothetical protein